MSYYAVRVGRQPGVYKTWEECKAQVERVSNNCHKKFSTEAEAWKFVNETEGGDLPRSQSQESSASAQASTMQHATERSLASQMENLMLDEEPLDHQSGSPASSQPDPSDSDSSQPDPSDSDSSQPGPSDSDSSQPGPSDSDSSKPGPSDSDSSQSLSKVSVYVHGSCADNGTTGAVQGIGVWWGPDHPDNVSERPADPGASRKNTCNRAVIHAALRAVTRAKEKGISELIIHTNSEYLINSMKEWIRTWKNNGWMNAKGKPVKNKDLFEKLDAKLEGMSVNWACSSCHSLLQEYVQRDQGLEGAVKLSSAAI